MQIPAIAADRADLPSALSAVSNAAWQAVHLARQSQDHRLGRIKELAFAADAVLLDQAAPAPRIVHIEQQRPVMWQRPGGAVQAQATFVVITDHSQILTARLIRVDLGSAVMGRTDALYLDQDVLAWEDAVIGGGDSAGTAG